MMTNGTPQSVHEQIVSLLPRLRRFARSLTRNAHDADDIVQIAVERALTRMAQFRNDARLDSWMFKIIRNAWIDEIRSRARRAEIFLADDTAAGGVAAAVDNQTDSQAIHAAMSRLPEEQRLAVSLVLIEGLSYKEAAAVLEIPVGTLTSRLARARDALQAMLRTSEGRTT